MLLLYTAFIRIGVKKMNNETKGTWGGRRANQTGRPKKPEGQRTQHAIRAYPHEWETIKEFVEIVKKNPERAARMMKIE